MKTLVALLIGVLLTTLLIVCSEPTVQDGRGGSRWSGEQRYWCELAIDMMQRPAAYNSGDPATAVRQGRDLWNGWDCESGGVIRGDQVPDTMLVDTTQVVLTV